MKNEIIRKAVEIAETRNAQAHVWTKGTKGKTEDEMLFIRNTNVKYFNSECDELLDDFIEIKDDNSFIRLRVTTLMDEYDRGNMEKYIEDNFDYAHGIKGSAESIISKLDDYEAIKERLIIRPLNYKNNRYFLENMVYTLVGDIALVLYAVVLDDEENGCLNTVKIPAEIFRKWNKDFDEVFASTMLNTNVIAMPRIYKDILNIENTSEKESALMNPDFTDKLREETIPLVTTTRKTNGAIALFYSGVKEKIAEMFDDSYYVAFTSVHEAMIHKAGTVAPEAIRRHIRATNTTFGPEDTLTNEVFYFDRNTRAFTVV